MIDQMGLMLSTLKVEEMRRSLALVGERDVRAEPDESKQGLRQVGRLLQTVGRRITSLGSSMKHGCDIAADAQLTEQEHSVS